MAKKFEVVQVTIRVDKTITAYLKGADPAHKKFMHEVLMGVRAFKNWSVQPKGDDEIAEGHPEVPGHPGHVDPPSKGWKINVERGKRTVDRLFLTKRVYKVEPSKRKPNVMNVKISARASVEEDTH